MYDRHYDADLNCVFCLGISTYNAMLQAFEHGCKYMYGFFFLHQIFIMCLCSNILTFVLLSALELV